ncbi:MAG: hypothetical protein JWO99_752 [Candidatus Saccharibacteria bacterium]|nr:hypothetical protein [Candidatus Saccharibacteria bacterium]
MLKVFLGFLVSVVVLLSSAYVGSPTYATSAGLVISHIQAGGVGVATQEFIAIYNNSSEEVDITGWCLTNKSNLVIVCFVAPVGGQAIYLPAHSYANAASSALAISQPIGTVTMTYVPISQSSGSITGGSDTVSLLDHAGAVVDRQSWTTSLAGGMQFERHGTGSPVIYQDSDLATDWAITIAGAIPHDQTTLDTTIVDVCPNIDGIQPVMPSGKELGPAGECVARSFMQLTISEVLPNAVGSDEGNEFIELFNPNDVSVDLTDYKLYVGFNDEGEYNFPTGSVIAAGEHLSFSNSDMPFTLLNSSSRITIALQDGTVVYEAPAYTDPKDGQSWADINDEWVYTNNPTPNLVNIVSSDKPVIEGSVTTALQPCADNQYRSLETNRCRLLTSLVGAVTPCKDGQYRSEETNRCRNIASEVKTIVPCDADEERNPETNRCRKIVTTTPASCKEGQERNPDTNRCRTITKMPSADYGVLGAETKSGGNWYALAAVGGVLVLALGYGVWEWHDEIGKFFKKTHRNVTRFVRVRK